MQCQARRRDGKQCGQDAIRGSKVCHYHGGKAPRVVAHAAELIEMVEAADLEARGLVERHEVTDPLAAIKREAAMTTAHVFALDARIHKHRRDGNEAGEFAALAARDRYAARLDRLHDRLLELDPNFQADQQRALRDRLAELPAPFTFDIQRPEADEMPALPAPAAQEAPEPVEAGQEPPEPDPAQDGALSREDRRRLADEEERRTLERSPWKPHPTQRGWEIA